MHQDIKTKKLKSNCVEFINIKRNIRKVVPNCLWRCLWHVLLSIVTVHMFYECISLCYTHGELCTVLSFCMYVCVKVVRFKF